MNFNMPSDNNGDNTYHFVLYIDSMNPATSHVADRLKILCKQYLIESYRLDIIDLREKPALVEEKKIIAAPTLDVTDPHSRQHRFVGDLSISETFIVTIGMGQVATKMEQEANIMKKNALTMRDQLKKNL